MIKASDFFFENTNKVNTFHRLVLKQRQISDAGAEEHISSLCCEKAFHLPAYYGYEGAGPPLCILFGHTAHLYNKRMFDK